MAPGMKRPAPDHRRLGALVAVVAAALVGSGTFFPRWWTGEQAGASMAVGLRHATLCGERGCAARGLETLGTADRAWALAGATGFAIGCVTAVFLVLAAALALARPGVWSARASRAAAGLSLVALVVGVGFAWTYPGFDGLALGASPFLYLGGAALGVGGAGVLLARRPA